MPLGHGAIAEFAVASVRGGGVQNVGSPFISGSSFAASVGDETVTGGATVSQSGTSLVSTFSIGTETVTGSSSLSLSTVGQITVGLGEETPFGESFQNLVTFCRSLLLILRFRLYRCVKDKKQASMFFF